MPNLRALKEVRYAGETYSPGDAFEASDKDARILKAVKKAADADVPKIVDLPKVKEVAAKPEAPLSEPNLYLRRDMQAGQIGEETSAPSSRRGRPRKERTLESSEGEAE